MSEEAHAKTISVLGEAVKILSQAKGALEYEEALWQAGGDMKAARTRISELEKERDEANGAAETHRTRAESYMASTANYSRELERCAGERDETRAEVKKLMDGMELAWGVIANSNGGNWEEASGEWRSAAAQWRDEHWHKSLDRNVGPTKSTEHEKGRDNIPSTSTEENLYYSWKNIPNNIPAPAHERVDLDDVKMALSRAFYRALLARPADWPTERVQKFLMFMVEDVRCYLTGEGGKP